VHGGVSDWAAVDVALDVDVTRMVQLFLGTVLPEALAE